MMVIDHELLEAFWSRVEKAAVDQCWRWTGPHGARGYPIFFFRRQRITATRLMLKLEVGIEPSPKHHACHTCDNPSCINPAHLWWGTDADNMQDCREKGRLAGQNSTHCRRGHALTPENTVLIMKEGYRTKKCRECARLGALRYSHKRINSAEKAGFAPRVFVRGYRATAIRALAKEGGL